ncbi:RHS repeat-associated core domain-containing protein [Pseudomonas sp. 7P_10.2_Bac1]|uniref:RHS repeat-associated core domain-containing protein n=1 Tax=Pseudomonas sp. 7P_10.2_Bac1 TaxID=2971614 RepID=UPI0021C79B56|nr:RHS repeat-associated core domain-containing protein [Pseudomonas sp. 7P_10.2_Bac1]MCU1727196.1 RHS repeat-associated core domain-containing protein [Pseudomonas sp. 7P_10.2_Bac1]
MPSFLHQHTPTLVAMDPRGLEVRSVAYHRTSSATQAQTRTWHSLFGATGFLQEQWDPRLYALHLDQAQASPNQRTHYTLTGRTLSTQSVDAGRRWLLRGAGGQVMTRWDSRGAQQRYYFDALLRPTDVFKQAAHEASARHVERLTYAGNDAPAGLANCCGRLIRHEDPSGVLLYEQYSLLGQLMSEQRMFYTSLTEPVLKGDSPRYSTRWHYNAFADLIEQTDAKGNLQRNQYAVDGQLHQSSLTLKGDTEQVLVDQRVFNARGQLESERAGNNVMTTMQYSPFDGRLKRLATYRLGQSNTPLQDLNYDYDRVGNVTRVGDEAQPIQWSSNTQVNPVSLYRYDSLYQLISATGRENAANMPTSALPGLVLFGATDSSVWRTYTQTYTHDEGGNLAQLKHQVSAGHGYTRTMLIASNSNHAVVRDSDAAPVQPGLGRDFDLNGNQLERVRGQALQWGVSNEVSAVALVTRENGLNDDEMYGYDGMGQRTRKVRTTRSHGQTHTYEVLYLPGLEIRRDTATGEQLNVIKTPVGNSDIKVLQWEQGRPHGMPDNDIRFSLSDHLGSSMLELNGKAELISQESYYPYGGTAWWAAKSALQGKYKITRYSGKELDASGLYYFGFRYYAPWLQRWVSPDPGGDVGGMNLYAMVGNNPITFKDLWGFNGGNPDTRPLRIQALDTFLRENHPHIYPSPLHYFDHQYHFGQALDTPMDDTIRAVRAAGYSYGEMHDYNESVSIDAPYPADIFRGLTDAYIASANYFNETARAMTNPFFNPEPGDWTGANVVDTFTSMQHQDDHLSEPQRAGLDAALSVSRSEAVSLLDSHVRSYPSGQSTGYRGHRVTDVGLKALAAHARQGDVLRTEQFLSVSDMPSVAKRFASGDYDTRHGTFNPVMLTVIGSSALELASPVNEAERIYPLQTAFKVENPGLSNLLVRAYAPSATHFTLREVPVTAQRRSALPFMTDPGGRRGR